MTADRSSWPDDSPLEEAVREALRSEAPAPFTPESATAIIAAAIDAAWPDGTPPGAGDDLDGVDADQADDSHGHDVGWLDAHQAVDDDLDNQTLGPHDGPDDPASGAGFEDA